MNPVWIDTIRLALRRKRVREIAATRPGIRVVDHPRAMVRVRTAGEGSGTVVFVCDPPNVIEHYDSLFDLLSPHMKVVCFEAPGFGFSFPKRGFGFRFEELSRIVGDLLSTLGMAPYVLAFSCVAAYAALRVAADHPALVEKVVLMQAPAWDEEVRWSQRVDPKGLIATPFIGQALMALRPHWVARRWYRVALRSRELVPHFDAFAHAAFDRGACFCLASLFQGWFKGKAPVFAPVQQPVLVCWGGSDRSHHHSAKKSILEYVPHAQWQVFETAGHFPELEEPERFSKTLKEFALSRP